MVIDIDQRQLARFGGGKDAAEIKGKGFFVTALVGGGGGEGKQTITGIRSEVQGDLYGAFFRKV